MTEKEGMICNKFRLAKDKKLQIKIDADVYCSGSVAEVLDILTKYGYDVSKYKFKPKLDDLEKEKRVGKFDKKKPHSWRCNGKIKLTKIKITQKLNKVKEVIWIEMNCLTN